MKNKQIANRIYFGDGKDGITPEEVCRLRLPKISEEYQKDYKYAMAHPANGVECQKHRLVFYHPVLGCPYCGKYSNTTPQSEELKKEWAVEFDERFQIQKKLYHLYHTGEYSGGHELDWKASLDETNAIKSFISEILAKQQEEFVKIVGEKVPLDNIRGCNIDFIEGYNFAIADIKSKLNI